ncbi:5-aminolevulic acid synthase isozyme [Rhodovulum sp. P5]|uniref:hypothetical protein n=1 Tax=Rhodovulum sp. P5 TaxID=1564506 RepID=UPI0009C37E7B|nr:hypothetical protein [Rhodovulum sp. P5]ARE38524.1 5-aminolevulic acid synthase isozyme [Rhodovulum sp. P5]
MKRIGAAGAALALCLASVAGAEPVDGKTARKLVFGTKKVEVRIVPYDFLSEQDRKALVFAGKRQAYYAAIAVAPSEGLVSNATLAATNFHDVASARRAALAQCDSVRKGGKPCVIAAEVVPKGWTDRPLTLSAAATAGLRKEYGRGGGEKALAISPMTGKWAVQKGAGAAASALSACGAHPGATDCRVVVADR